jgi:hypothetical protein
VLWSILWFFLFFMWIWLVIAIFADIIRSHDMGGWAKALWSIFIIFLPFLGVFVYLIARGGSMAQRSVKQAQDQEQQFRAYVQDAAGGADTASQLDRLAGLHTSGKLTDEEFAQAKAKLIG